MRLVRGAGALGIGIAAFMLFSGTASAQWVDVWNEVDAEPCSDVVLNGHNVFGGCSVEFQSTEHILMVVYMPQPFVRDSCNWHLEARIGGSGSGYVTQAVVSDEDPPATPPCTLQACDEVVEGQHTFIPWPLEIVENAPGDEELTLQLCLVGINAPEGALGLWCTVHLPFGEVASHELEIGSDPSEEPCEETVPNFDFSLGDAHLRYEEGSAALEILH